MDDECLSDMIDFKDDVDDLFKEYPILLTPTSYNLVQETIDDIRNIEIQQQFEQINNNSSSSIDCDITHMDLDDFCFKKPEQTMSQTNTTTNDDNTTHQEQMSQPITTDNTNTNEQQINAFEYVSQLLSLANIWKPVLVKLSISGKTADDYLKSLSIPSPDEINLTDQDPLNKFSNFLERGIHLFSSFRPIYSTNNIDHTYPVGEELNESWERATSAPSEDNRSHLDQDIPTSTQSKLSTSTTSKDVDTTTLSLSLSKLLSQAKTIIQQLNFIELKIDKQPQQFWTKRTINCLKNKWAVCIQDRSGKQQHYPSLKWSNITKYDRKHLFVLIQLLSYDDHPHSSNIIVPAGTRIKEKQTGLSKVEKRKSSTKRKNEIKTRSKLEDLIINNGYGFDKNKRAILCPISDQEYNECQKSLQLIMFSLYETSEEIVHTNDDDEQNEEIVDTNDDNEENEEIVDTNDDDEQKEDITSELRKLSKLRICICRQIKKNKLKYISNFVDTELIDQCIGSTRTQLAIDKFKVTPTKLCDCGNEKITVPLNKNSEKQGLNVRFNGINQDRNQFSGVKQKQILIKSRPNIIPREKCLRVEVLKKNMLKTIKNNFNPYEHVEEDTLLSIDIPYVKHSDNEHFHKNVNTTIAIQSNEIN